MEELSQHLESLIEWSNKNEGFILIVLTLAYTVATFFLVRTANRSNQQALALENERTKPHLVLSMSRITDGFPLVSVALENVGIRSAKNVKVTIDPPLVKLRKPNKTTIFANRFSYFPPGHKVSDVISSYPDFRSQYPDLFFNICVEYEDEIGKIFKNEFSLDYDYWLAINYPPPNSDRVSTAT